VLLKVLTLPTIDTTVSAIQSTHSGCIRHMNCRPCADTRPVTSRILQTLPADLIHCSDPAGANVVPVRHSSGWELRSFYAVYCTLLATRKQELDSQMQRTATWWVWFSCSQ